MLTLEIQNEELENRITELMRQTFDGDAEKMLQEFLRAYQVQRERLQYSGILEWAKDGLAYQRDVRSEWD